MAAQGISMSVPSADDTKIGMKYQRPKASCLRRGVPPAVVSGRCGAGGMPP